MSEQIGPAGPEQQTFPTTNLGVTPTATYSPEDGSGILVEPEGGIHFTGNNEVGALNLEVIQIPVDRAALAVNGLRRRFAMWRLVRSEMNQLSSADTRDVSQKSAAFYKGAARASLGQLFLTPNDEEDPRDIETRSTRTPYDPINASDRANRRQRAGFSGSQSRFSKDHNESSGDPTTASQKRAARRNARRANESLDHGYTRTDINMLRGPLPLERKSLRAHLKARGFTGSEKRTIRNAGNTVRRSTKKIDRSVGRLVRDTKGRSLAGRVLAANIHKNNINIMQRDRKSMRLAGKVHGLEAAAQARQDRIAAAQQARKDRKNHRRRRTASSTT